MTSVRKSRRIFGRANGKHFHLLESYIDIDIDIEFHFRLFTQVHKNKHMRNVHGNNNFFHFQSISVSKLLVVVVHTKIYFRNDVTRNFGICYGSL